MPSIRVTALLILLAVAMAANQSVYAKTVRTAFSSLPEIEKAIGAKGHIIFVDTARKEFSVKSFNAAGNLVVEVVGSEQYGYTLTRYGGDAKLKKVIDTVVVDAKENKVVVTTSNRNALNDWLTKYMEALVKGVGVTKSAVSPEEYTEYGEKCAKDYFFCALLAGPIGQVICFAKLLFCMAQAPDVSYNWTVTDEHCGRDGCKEGEKCCDTGKCVKRNTPCPTPDFGEPR